jgi:type IV pilus assembly protein PilC
MATAAAARNVEGRIFEWEGKDKNGKVVRGEIRAGGEAVVSASLRRQGILVTKVKKRAPRRQARSSRRTSRSSRASWPP